MRIFVLSTTTGTTALNVGVRGTYTTQKAYRILSEKAIDIYRRNVEAEPRLAEFNLRICVFESKTDGDGIFKNVSTTYRDFAYKDGKVEMVSEKVFNK